LSDERRGWRTTREKEERVNVVTRRHVVPVVLVLCLCHGYAPHAQSVQSTPGADKNPLARVTRLTCTFSSSAVGSWKTGAPESQLKPEQSVLEFDSIDAQEGTARIVGSSSDITALLTANSLHFLDRSFLGNLTITTVFSLESSKGKYAAVRSRHDYLPQRIPGLVSDPTVVQYYGVCEVPQ
jgi:hypothetical protein